MKFRSIIALLCVAFLSSTVTTNAQRFKEAEKTFQLNADGKVYIDTYKGEIKIETWDKPEVHVYAKMVPDESGFMGTSPKKQLERVDVEFDSSPDELEIKSAYEKDHSWFGNNTLALVNYEIQMPKTASLKIKDYKSETKINGVHSAIELETYKGEVHVKDLAGSIDLETYKGEIDVAFSKLTNNSSFDTYKGEIEITVPKNTSFTVDADLDRKADLNTNLGLEDRGNRKKHGGYEFTKDINGGGSVIKISSGKGEIRLYER